MIKEFQGKYRWLSNFAPVNIILSGIQYRSVEHAYMSEKSDELWWKYFCRDTIKPGDVKRKSKDIKLFDDWYDKRVGVMAMCIEQKYNIEPYKTNLINTGNLLIQEGNYWNDKFWGVCLKTNEGLNVLGKLIMSKREQLKIDLIKKEYKDIITSPFYSGTFIIKELICL